MSKIRIFLILFCLSTLSIFAQDQDPKFLLETDLSWRSETFDFPIPFAPEINFTGKADVRFSNGWGKAEKDDFWTYVISWQLDENPNLTATKTEEILALYFDGLMKVIVKDSTIAVDETLAVFVPRNGEKNKNNTFVGKVRLFDGFFSKELVTLNVTAEYSHCPVVDKYFVLFRFSPQDFDHSVWVNLNGFSSIQKCGND